MPLGPPPCAEDPHHHAMAPHAREDIPLVPDLEAKVKMANDYVESEFQALIAARYKMKDLVRRQDEEWEKNAKPLEQVCNQTRESLLKLAEQSGECEAAQNTELAELFKKRHKDKSHAPIVGCAAYKEAEKLVQADDCKCAAGSEKDGCRGAKIASDHNLLCTHLRTKVLPSLALWRATSPGGSCMMDQSVHYNKAMLPEGQPDDFRMPVSAEAVSSMPEMLLALPPPPRLETRSRDRGAAAKRARAFL